MLPAWLGKQRNSATTTLTGIGRFPPSAAVYLRSERTCLGRAHLAVPKSIYSVTMWLDRFSGHSTPSGSPPPPQNRSYSPAPRRPSHLASEPRRPSFTPRSSSLNPGARLNQQSNSLNSPRLPNGSNLKQQMPPPADTIDPLSVLEEIVGRPIQKEALSNGITDSYAELERPSQLFEDVDFNGQSLQAFAAAGPGEIMNGVPGNQRVSTQTVVECEYV